MATRSGGELRLLKASGLDALPHMPEFTTLQLGHLDAIRRFTAGFEGYSDFDATSLWAWSAASPGGFRVGRWGANLVVEFGDYLGEGRFLSFLGTDRVDDAASVLVDIARTRGTRPELRLVPEVTAELLDRRQWLLVDQRDDHDYVYDVPRGAALEGSTFRRRRERISRFRRRHAQDLRLEWIDAERLAELGGPLLRVFDSWSDRKTEIAGRNDRERRAFEHLVRTAPNAAPNVEGCSVVCWRGGRIVGFSIVAPSSRRSLCAHFQKVVVDDGLEDLESWMSWRILCQAAGAGYHWINEQQDLGIPGLRQAKLARRPARMLRKYRI